MSKRGDLYMNASLHIPAKLKVGFQERGDTYTGKLAYVIPMNEKGKVRKEKSFESWRDHNYVPEEYENEPMSGFVLNKKAGGYATGWNHRKTYIRVYDPRGFEVEISVENHLYILEHTNSIVGKGLEGEFVYSWSGKNLVLLPVNAPEYVAVKKEEEMIETQGFLTSKKLKVGATYKTLDDSILVYLGKYDEYRYDWRNYYRAIKKSKPTFHFCEIRTDRFKELDYKIHRYPTISKKLTEVIDESEHPLLSDMMETLEGEREFSPIALGRTAVTPVSFDEFILGFGRTDFQKVVAKNGQAYFVYNGREMREIHFLSSTPHFKSRVKNMYEGEVYDVKTLEEIYELLEPCVVCYHLQNGRLYEKRVETFNPNTVKKKKR